MEPAPETPREADACPACGGTGWVSVDGATTGPVRRCDCYREAGRQRRLDAVGIPSRYHHAMLENFSITQGMHRSLEAARVRCENYVEGFREADYGLLFVGPAGVGKTHLAVAVLRELVIRHGVVGRFADYRDLLRAIQDSYNPVSESSEMEVLRPVLAAEVLLLDELGSRRPSDWVHNTVTQLLNDRYRRQRITLFTTNYPDEPAQPGDTTLGDRIGIYARSRLFQMCKVVKMQGEDFREKFGNVGTWTS